MPKRIRWLLLLSPLLAAASLAAKEPVNLEVRKDELRAYVRSGEYDRDIAAVAAQARTWIERRAPRGGAKLAIVFDLDETLFSNWPEIQRLSFGNDDERYATWMESARCPAIEPVCELYRTARRLGLSVLLITGRTERFRAATARNLRAIGCGEYAALVCAPDDYQGTAERFKTSERARFEAQGYTIVANIGDQASDLAGGHAERTFKLPDPFYLTP